MSGGNDLRTAITQFLYSLEWGDDPTRDEVDVAPFLLEADRLIAAVFVDVNEGHRCPNCSMVCHDEADLRYCHPTTSSRCPGPTAWDGEIQPVLVVRPRESS